MKSSLLSVLFFALPFFTIAQVDEPSLNLYFGYDLDELTDEHRSQLSEFVSSLECDSVLLEVSGHTDNHASDEYNLALSQRRVNAAMLGLAELGISAAQVSTERKGEFVPVATNDLDDGRAKNRRVEIRIVDCEDESSNASGRQLLTLDILLDSLQFLPSVHSIQGRKASAIDIGEQGVLFVPEESFINPRTQRVERGDIKLHVYVIESEGDLIRSKVVTRTSSDILQSAGMIRVVPMKGNDTLIFAKTLRMSYFRSIDPSFGAFVGYMNLAQNAVYWKNAPSSMLGGGPSDGFLKCGFKGIKCNCWCTLKMWVGGLFSTRDRGLTLDQQKVLEYAFPDGVPDNAADSLEALYERYDVDLDEPVVTVLEKMYADEIDDAGLDNFSEFYQMTELDKERDAFLSGRGDLQNFEGALNISTSAWNNLDRFQKLSSSEQVSLFITNVGPYNEDYVRVIVPRYDICVEPIGGTVSPLKRGADVTVFGLRVVDGIIYLAETELEVDNDHNRITLEYREVSFDEVQTYIVKMEENLFY
ncbi:MAG: OmpA family protein [Flavobacteriia bacterium]|nr:OmpA family protein [Flavobacteriia bacterium]